MAKRLRELENDELPGDLRVTREELTSLKEGDSVSLTITGKVTGSSGGHGAPFAFVYLPQELTLSAWTGIISLSSVAAWEKAGLMQPGMNTGKGNRPARICKVNSTPRKR